MDHAEFARAFRAGEISVRLDRALALRVVGSPLLPARYRAAHAFWSWLRLLMFPAAIALGIWYSWWAALLCFLISFPVSSGVKASAFEFVLEHAVADRAFYERLLPSGLFHIEPKAGARGVIAPAR